MAAPIIAALDPYVFDRAPVDLAVAAGELTGARVIAASAVAWHTDEVARRLDELHRDLGVETRMIEDLSAARAMHTLANNLEAALVVVGSTNRGRTGRVLIGSTAEAMLQGAPCPVAVAPHAWVKRAIQTIAVGFVDSPEGHVALATAHALAARVSANLRVIAALHPSGGFDAARSPGLRPQRGALLEGRDRTEIKAAVERAVAALPGGVDVTTEFHVDDPGEVLERVSAHVDLLICGSRGYGPLRAVLLGGVSHRLVRDAACPVLILPRGVDTRLTDLGAAADALAAQ
jgi:nucleotide-binding universal stress UspA family protein